MGVNRQLVVLQPKICSCSKSTNHQPPTTIDLANSDDPVLYVDMLRRIREEWSMARRSTKVFIILGGTYLLAGLVGVAYMARNWHAPTEETEDSRKAAEVTESESPVRPDFLANRHTREQDILNEYFKVMGGVEKLASLKSVRAMGEITFPNGKILRVVVVKKDGGYFRFILGVAPNQVVFGVNPDDAWQYSWEDGREMVEDLDPEQLVTMRRSGYPVSKLFMAMYNEWKVTYLGEKAFNYKMAHVFEVKIGAHETARFFIDPETYIETGFEEWIIDDDGVIITRHVQSDHIVSDGVRFPGTVETYINGELSHTFRVRKVEVNPGILNSSFERPELGSGEAPKP